MGLRGGGAPLAKRRLRRIKDRRTRLPCDYDALLAELLAAVAAGEAASEDSAADLIARRAGRTRLDRESIARRLRAKLKTLRERAAEKQGTAATTAVSGLIALWETLGNRIGILRSEADTLTTPEQCAAAADKAAKIRRIVETRQAEQSSIPPADATSAAARLLEGGIDDMLTPESLLQREREMLDALLTRVRDLQRAIEGRAGGWREF